MELGREYNGGTKSAKEGRVLLQNQQGEATSSTPASIFIASSFNSAKANAKRTDVTEINNTFLVVNLG